MDLWNNFEHHLDSPRNRGHLKEAPHTGVAGGAACGDLVRISLEIEGDTVVDAGFDASGCGAVQAAGSAAVDMVLGESLWDAALVSPHRLSDELGGLSVAKFHAVELAADALARALGSAAFSQAQAQAHPDRTLVAMSGGVDSSLCALLCQQAGREVVAVTLELWADSENDADRSCCSASAVRWARLQAQRLGIPHFTLDLRDRFRSGVVNPYLEGHAEGITPNPCIRCNGDVRLDAMLEMADHLGAADLATGHYARVASTDSGVLLRQAEDKLKDQSYMLAGLSLSSLERMRFPLGELTKPEVRALASEAGLISADKPDSQDLCFLAGTTREAFLARHGGIMDRPGPLVDHTGRQVGTHGGAHRFTVGQRRGIGVAAEYPLYVLEVDSRENRVTVGPREMLGQVTVPLAGLRLHRPATEVTSVKLRYRSEPIACRLADPLESGRHRRALLELAEPVEGVAPGQAACLLQGDLVVGLATISPR